MELKTTCTLVFSPTNTTKKVVQEICHTIHTEHKIAYDITSPKAITQEIPQDALTIIGVPVYAGRIPPLAAERLKSFHANQAPAVIVVVYGNRAYDDALLELSDLATACGFNIIAGAAFIGEHSFSSQQNPIAPLRPDTEDCETARRFGQQINDLIEQNNPSPLIKPIPGNHPYKPLSTLPTAAPDSDSTRCTHCGICAQHCPTGAITIKSQPVTDASKCIWCCACVKLCPENARVFNHEKLISIATRLSTQCATRKAVELFI